MLTEAQKAPESIAERENARMAVLASFERLGLRETNLSRENIERLVILERKTKFNLDSRMVEKAVHNLLYQYSELTEQEKMETRLAALVHDIGKAGPAHADEEAQEAVAELFAEERVSPQLLVKDAVIGLYEKSKAGQKLAALRRCGVTPEMSLREFWDLHGRGSDEVLHKFPIGISENTRRIAASHHIDRGTNPYAYSITPEEGKDPLPLAAKILIAADKAQAAYRRSPDHPTPPEAVERARKMMQGKFGSDPQSQEILRKMADLVQAGNIFETDLTQPKTAIATAA